MSQLPSFSMIVSTFQRRDMVCEAVTAIGEIEYDGEFELIVIIDGSEDGTVEALSSLDPPFPYRVIWQPNAGLAAARNRGAAEARHEVLFFLDDDMICTRGIVQEHARRHQDGAAAVLGEIPLEAGSPPGFLTEGIADWAERSAQDARSAADLTPFQIFGGQLSVRRDAFEAIGGFDTSFTENGGYGQEDADFGVRLLRDYRVMHAPEAISFHRYIVTPGDNMRRAFKAGIADAKFLRRHPSLAPKLALINGHNRRLVRYGFKPIARFPLFPQVFAFLVSRLAAMALKTSLRSNRYIGIVYFVAQQIAYWSAVHRSGGFPRARKAMVLCYHAVADHSHDPILKDYSIPRPEFVRQIDELRTRGFTFISPDDFLLFIKGVIRLPRKAVLLTFDDCYSDLLEVARDVLKPRGIEAIAFAVTAMQSGTNEWDQAQGAQTLQLLGKEGLIALSKTGIEIGAHSRSHRSMPELSDTDLSDETIGAANDLKGLGLGRVRFFAYPFGGRDARCMEAVMQGGYEAAFGLADQRVKQGKNFYNLPRIEINASDGRFRFWLKTTLPYIASFLRTRLFAWTRSHS